MRPNMILFLSSDRFELDHRTNHTGQRRLFVRDVERGAT